MKRNLAFFIFGMIVGGSIVVFIPIYYFIPSPKEAALDMLKDAEDLSREYFIHEDPTARGSAQAYYILHSYRAWESGMIPDSDYYRAQAIGFLRFCIVKEQKGEEKVAKSSCEMAKQNLKLWNPDMRYEKFRNLVNSKDFMGYMLPNKALKKGTPTSGAP